MGRRRIRDLGRHGGVSFEPQDDEEEEDKDRGGGGGGGEECISSNKRLKRESPPNETFHQQLLEQSEKFANEYVESTPFKHVVIPELLDSELLARAKEEIISQLSWTTKETDIYKVNQTGDLANISGLDADEKKRLGALMRVRDLLYSSYFRAFLDRVTGCGKLSGTKTDMSINLYTYRQHLLPHDDVIGTRRVSYILYLTEDPWTVDSGGNFRLYDVNAQGIPESEPCKSIPPSFNQMVLFVVQPGASFHDVEEVYSDGLRLAISGWFHLPQNGEDGYDEKAIASASKLSSLQQLELKSANSALVETKAVDDGVKEAEELSPEDIAYLGEYIHPDLLKADSIERLNEILADTSSIQIPKFLTPKLASQVYEAILDQDNDGSEKGWQVAGPIHSRKFLFLPSDTSSVPNSQIWLKICDLFTSKPFRNWLRCTSGFNPTSESVICRRFRPGKDYTLATSYESKNLQLEITLGLTPSARDHEKQSLLDWEDGDVGGYEAYMAAEDDDSADAAVYKAQSKPKPKAENDDEDEVDGDDEDDSVLLNTPAQWNNLTLVVRDVGVLRFVKYVSKAAKGSRWDITCTWQIE